MKDLNQLYRPLLHEILAVSDSIRKKRSGTFRVFEKDDGTPVTDIDLWAHQALNDILSPRGVVVSEESTNLKDPSLKQALRSQGAWLVDPIDGTRDFVQGLDSYVVCVAWVDISGPRWGCIAQPEAGRISWAARGEGAWTGLSKEIELGTETRLVRRPFLSGQEVVAGASRTNPSERLQEAYDQLGVTRVVQMGSALKFVALASGVLDVFPRFGLSFEWDTAAGQIIVEESGAQLLALDTFLPLSYGKDGWRNAQGFISAPGEFLTPKRQARLTELRHKRQRV